MDLTMAGDYSSPSGHSSKSGKSSQQIEVLTMRVDAVRMCAAKHLQLLAVVIKCRMLISIVAVRLQLEKELDELEERTNLHPVDPSFGDNVDRIESLAAGLPEGCAMSHFGN